MFQLDKFLLLSKNKSTLREIPRQLYQHPEWQNVYIDKFKSLTQALAEISVMGYQFIIADCENFDKTPIELLIQLRAKDQRIPIILLNQPGAEKTAIAALKSGANDYVLKDRDWLTHLPIVIESTLQEAYYRKEVRKRFSRLKEENENLRKLKAVDEKTHFYSENFFYELVNKETKRALRHGMHLSCICLDLANEDLDITYDKATIKRVYEELAQTLKSVVRATDIWAKLSEERFIALLPHTTIDEAKTAISRIGSEIKDLTMTKDMESPPFEIKWGLASYDHSTSHHLVDLVAQAMNLNH